VQPLLHARADAVDLLQLQPEQHLRQVGFGDENEAVRLLHIGRDLAEEHIGRDADRAGEAFADLRAQSAFELVSTACRMRS
jgi:hypothetical protein